jgi:hypothetical protein
MNTIRHHLSMYLGVSGTTLMSTLPLYMRILLLSFIIRSENDRIMNVDD